MATPIAWPLIMVAPSLSSLLTGSKLLRSPLPWSITITGLSTTTPTKLTVPSAGAVTGTPSPAACRSTPRCPLCQGLSGGSKLRTTAGLGESGHIQSGRGLAAAAPDPGAEAAGVAPKASTKSRRTRRFAVLMEQAFVSPVSLGSRKADYVENPRENAGVRSLNSVQSRSRGWGRCSTLGGAVCCALELVQKRLSFSCAGAPG